MSDFEFVLVNAALVNAHHLGQLSEVALFKLARMVRAEMERREVEEERLPWPDGRGRHNPNRDVVAKAVKW